MESRDSDLEPLIQESEAIYQRRNQSRKLCGTNGSIDIMNSGHSVYDIRDFTQRRREGLTTAFATEMNWDDDLVLSTVKLRYATFSGRRSVLLARNAKHNSRFSVVYVYRPVTFCL